MKEAGKIREGGTDESQYKSKDNKKCKGRCEQGEREKERRGSTWWTAGPGARGSSSGSGRQVKVVLSSCLVQMQQPKLCSNLTFQKHRLIQLSLLSPLLSYVTHHFLPPLPFSICSLLSSALIPVTFPQLLIYFFPSHSRCTPLYYSPPITLLRIFFFSHGNSPSFSLSPH